MPLLKGVENIGKNISELHKGKTYAHTATKFGKKKADKQAVAIAIAQARKAKAGKGKYPIPNKY
jgi:hypothetical protein